LRVKPKISENKRTNLFVFNCKDEIQMGGDREEEKKKKE
jgi:hypothetical protein